MKNHVIAILIPLSCFFFFFPKNKKLKNLKLKSLFIQTADQKVNVQAAGPTVYQRDFYSGIDF